MDTCYIETHDTEKSVSIVRIARVCIPALMLTNLLTNSASIDKLNELL